MIGVAGGTGSGKTTVADEIVRRVGLDRIVTLHQDRYYRDLSHVDEERRHGRNFDHPDAIESELLIEHLSTLKSGRAVPLPVYDFARHLRTPEVHWAQPRPVILLEGILVLADAGLRELLDIKLFVDTGAKPTMALVEKEDKGLLKPPEYFHSLSGTGLRGDVFADFARAFELKTGGLAVKNILVNFVENESFPFLTEIKGDGILGLGTMYRFNMIFDYDDPPTVQNRIRRVHGQNDSIGHDDVSVFRIHAFAPQPVG